MKAAFIVIGSRYSVEQLNKVQDVLGDLEEAKKCAEVFDLITKAREA